MECSRALAWRRLTVVSSQITISHTAADKLSDGTIMQQSGSLPTTAGEPDLDNLVESEARQAIPKSGLFFEDYGDLPTLTDDMDEAKRDIDVYGYALWADALTPVQIDALAARIVEQHEAEMEASGALDKPDGVTGNVNSIPNKGTEFTDLLVHPEATELLTYILGEQYQLSTGFVKIVKPGAKAELLHTDQWWSAVPQRRVHGQEAQPPIRSGSITRELAYTADWHTGDNGDGPGTVSYIPPCVANQALFCISDFTAENGATMLVPGSHLSGRHPTKSEAAEGGKAVGAIPLCAPAGTCIVFDSRCWHMSGGMSPECTWQDQRTGHPWRLGCFYNYVAPMIRQNENWALSLDPEVFEELSNEQRLRLGLKTWFGYGRVGKNAGVGDQTFAQRGTNIANSMGKDRATTTHDGNFELRAEDDDGWIGRESVGARRMPPMSKMSKT